MSENDENDYPDTERAAELQGCAISQLVARFPRIFHGQPPTVPSHLSPGWRAIVYGAFGEIDSLLSDDEAANIRVGQIKEKFGVLTIYAHGIPRSRRSQVIERETHSTIKPAADGEEIGDRVQAILDDAMEKSTHICDMCGLPGKIRPASYIACRCEEHVGTGWIEWNRAVLSRAGNDS